MGSIEEEPSEVAQFRVELKLLCYPYIQVPCQPRKQTLISSKPDIQHKTLTRSTILGLVSRKRTYPEVVLQRHLHGHGER